MKTFALSIIFLLFSFGSVHSGMAASGNHDPQKRKGLSSEKDKEHEHTHWGYRGVEGPDHWAMLNPSYNVCETGRQQSPINIVMPRHGHDQEDLEFHYQPTPLSIRNNGHTIQVNYQGGSYLRLKGQSYKLRQFHFHDPSEHHIDGKVYPMEMHLVHQNERGHLLVVGVLLAFGKENRVFSRVGTWMQQHTGSRLPSTGQEVSTDLTFNLMDILPQDTHHFSYHGSLTTPPCSEGVQWIVLKSPIQISKVQADRFITTVGPNARPVQSLEHRDVQEN
ncbi:MAG: carbonic anhydrase family protein [Nitrospinae bacterium]|nr:carbonic anhydrase family protein [Nitrospinota bacterium]